MNAFTNLLTSGHNFSEDENLLKFRFLFLNGNMLVVLFFTSLNYLASVFGGANFGSSFENAILLFLIINFYVFYLLRRQRSYYLYIVNYFIISSLVLFYFVLITRTEDEFRLISFFMATFMAYILLGRKYGLFLSLFIISSILILSMLYDLALSLFAFSTFFTFFIIFTVSLFFFLKKVESDAVEYELLNSRLEENVKKETQQRKDQEIMLLHQSRMANMGEMLDSIAHQWRQPLMHINSILMNMDVALDTKQKNKDYLPQKIEEVAALTLHMSQTIDDFRGLFTFEKEQHHFAIENVIDDVIALMKNRFDNISVDYKAEGDTLIYGYKNELIQVIIILLDNAVDAFDKPAVNNRFININTVTSQDNCLITIEDNAGGIISENTTTIFDPYFTTKEQSGGTGLGLYIAKIIIEQKMNGSITASNTTAGAKFSISLTHDTNQKV